MKSYILCEMHKNFTTLGTTVSTGDKNTKTHLYLIWNQVHFQIKALHRVGGGSSALERPQAHGSVIGSQAMGTERPGRQQEQGTRVGAQGLALRVPTESSPCYSAAAE